jgi:hypothetical protein
MVKVSCAFFAGTQECGGGLVVEVASPEAWTCGDGGCSSVASLSSVKEGFKRLTNGSRFWVLSEDGDSDSKSCVDEAGLSGARDVPIAVPNPQADAENWGPPAALGAPRFTPLGAVSCDGDRDNRPWHPKSMRGGANAGRPWQGPLPPARVSPARSLGDLWMRDRRSGAKGGCSRLAELLAVDVGQRLPAMQPETVKMRSESRDPDSNEGCPVVVPVGINGSTSGTVAGCNWAGKFFRGMQGLGRLFRWRDGRFASSSHCHALYHDIRRVPRVASVPPPPVRQARGVHLLCGSAAA